MSRCRLTQLSLPAILIVFIVCLAATTSSVAAETSSDVNFDHEVRPILSSSCFLCHGPDEGSRVGGYRLDLRAEATKLQTEGTPIVPGDPDHSEVIKRIFSKDSGNVMPPASANLKLTAAQKDTIRRWIAQGAKYEGHWSYEPIRRPAVPVTSQGVKNPIDAFILARLAKEGLKPSPEADRRTLIRRVSLDLTGLLPAPEAVTAFVADRSPNAYEKLVDKLLASPEYAEQQTIHWLDAVRYADSAGFHSDGTRPIWPYRDYVLRAFLNNKPFDNFTREQLAGDLIPKATVEQKVAAAYNRLNRTSAEGGLQPKEYLAKYGSDRVRDLGSAWLAMSLGCADCHDHKFDPILTKDFYAMQSFFADIKEDGLVEDVGPKAFKPTMPVYGPGQKEAIDSLRAKIAFAKAELDHRAEALVEQRQRWERDQLARYHAGDLAWKFLIPVEVSAHSATLMVQNEAVMKGTRTAASMGPGMISVTGANPDNETYNVILRPGAGTWASLGIETGQDDSLPGASIARGSDRFVVTEIDAELEGAGRKGASKLPFLFASSDVPSNDGLSPMGAIDGDSRTGWGLVSGAHPRGSMLMLRFTQPVTTDADSRVVVHIHQDSEYRKATLGRFRLALVSNQYAWPGNGRARGPAATVDRAAEAKALAEVQAARDKTPGNRPGEISGKVSARSAGTPIVSPEAPPVKARANAAGAAKTPPKASTSYGGMPEDFATALELAPEKRSEEQRKVVLDYFEYSNPQLLPARVELAKLEAKSVNLVSKVPEVMLTEPVEPQVVRILPHGNWMDETGAIVQPAIPEFLGKLNTGGKRATRMDLANWLVSGSNPLTARVFVNRMWRELFGIGISKNLEDFGSQGEAPAHPELLDWLSSEFMKPEYQAVGAHPWDVKHLLRTMVTSATYKQSSLATPELDKRDPDNRLLARQSRFRMGAESVRDTALEISGLLVRQFGGATARPYEPEGYLAALNFPKRAWSASHGDDLYRRSVYTHWQRTFLHPSLANFDAPSREECTVSRVSSDTPLQALDLLNDPIFVEAARVFAEKILEKGGKTLEAKLAWAFERSLERKPNNTELKVLRDLYQSAAIHFNMDPAAVAGLLAIGDSPVPRNMKPADLAIMTSVARVILNLHEAITRD